MRLLTLHVDYFTCTITEKGRSKVFEDLDPNSRTTAVNEALLVLASVEKQDETNPEIVSKKATEEISSLAKQLKVDTIVLHPFAHLFAELSKPEVAIKVLKLTQEELLEHGFRVIRTPFGWFNTLELKAKGHPLSRVARIISAI
jgi:threonyl-tRNA synthetase